jgi:hypothetical protein
VSRTGASPSPASRGADTVGGADAGAGPRAVGGGCEGQAHGGGFGKKIKKGKQINNTKIVGRRKQKLTGGSHEDLQKAPKS